MKFKLSGTSLILLSLVLFLITNFFLWTSVVERIAIYTQNLAESARVQANNRLNEADNRLLSLYKISKKNVLFIRDLVEIDIANQVDKTVTTQKLAKFIELDNNYFQARLIDASGKETIKAELIDNSVFLFSPERLQNKGERYYFKESLASKKGNVFVSNLDLNMEDGKIEYPLRPTVRFFTPLFNGNEKIGVIGLNLNIGNWFDYFKGKNIGILNSEDEVYFDKKIALYKKFDGDLNQKDQHGHPEYFYKKTSLEGNYFWTLYTRPDNNSIHAKITAFKKSSYRNGAVLSAGVLFFLLIAYNLNRKNVNISKLNQAVENRLNEREILIKEIHHRVKNNLQVVTSLLSLQSSFIKDEGTKALFRYSQYRINSMGIIHEMLYKSDNLDQIDYGVYIKKLIDALVVSMKGRGSKIQVLIEVENILLNIDTAIPMGLLINEVVTNSLKYGFADKEDGTITVKIEKLDRTNYKLMIGDNGPGFPSSINFRNTKSLGLKLIHKLALQLKGNIEKDDLKNGTNYIITFEEIEQIS